MENSMARSFGEEFETYLRDAMTAMDIATGKWVLVGMAAAQICKTYSALMDAKPEVYALIEKHMNADLRAPYTKDIQSDGPMADSFRKARRKASQTYQSNVWNKVLKYAFVDEYNAEKLAKAAARAQHPIAQTLYPTTIEPDQTANVTVRGGAYIGAFLHNAILALHV
jgi:hypothetical protein